MPVAFEILGKRCEIGERLVDLNSMVRSRSSAPRPPTLLTGRGGEQLFAQRREATSDLRPMAAAMRAWLTSSARKPTIASTCSSLTLALRVDDGARVEPHA